MIILLQNIMSEISFGKDEPNLLDDIREYLSVKNPGAWFAKKHNPYANDYRYFCTARGKFPTGFFPAVYSLCEELAPGMVQVIDKRDNLVYMDDDIDINVKHWDLRENQLEMVRACNNYQHGYYWPRGIVDAATNAGKNSIIAAIHKNTPDSKTLMLIHNQDIKNQAIEFFGEIFDVGQVHGNKMELEKPFVVAMAKTLLNRASSLNVKRLLNQFNMLIVDEGHRAGSKDYANLIGMVNAGQRYLVSGTPLDMTDPIRKMLLLGMFGNVLGKITNTELIEQGYSNNVQVYMYENNVGTYTLGSYEENHEVGIKFSIKRVEVIKKYLIENPQRQVLISVDHLDHGNFIYENLSAHCNIRQLYGSNKDRDELIEKFKNQEFRVLVTTLMQEGINAPIDTIMYLQGGVAKIPLKQYIGRGLRRAGNFDVTHVVDFFDDMDFLDRHSRARLRVYHSEKFPVQIMYEHNIHGSPKIRKYEFD